jgi:hypothetical protein
MARERRRRRLRMVWADTDNPVYHIQINEINERGSVTARSTSETRVTVSVLKTLTSGVLCSIDLAVKLPTQVFIGSYLGRKMEK